MTIATELSPLPTLLAGPIVRRVTAQQATIWLASSHELPLELRLFDANNNPVSQPGGLPTYQNSRPRPPQTSVQLGDNLWVTLLEAQPLQVHGSFPLDTLLSYELYDTDAQTILDLNEVCLNGETRPGFYIPSQIQVLAYGSCRKAHGLTFNDDDHMQDKDSLALLADHLQECIHNLAERPAMLFLVGDQMYADDVHPELLSFVQKLAVQLMGRDIPLPIAGCSSQFPIAQYKGLKTTCGLTSSSKYGHVLSFGEYAALYLVMLGNRVGFECSPAVPIQGAEVFKLDFYDSAKEEAFEQRSLFQFVQSQPQVRKTFANIPTYMNFDDHDITDDWNLSRSWYDAVRHNRDGTRVISNALAAYWAFQAWGNEPSTFAPWFIRRITNHLFDPEDPVKANAYDFHLWKLRRWNFVLPTNPPIFVTDSRTQRDFGRNNEPPHLMDRYALDWMRGEWLDITNKEQTPIIITATPVCGFSSIEWLQYFLYGLNRFLGNYITFLSASSLDVESWIANRRGFAFFMDTLLVRMNLRKVTFLSGDVHYSFANKALYINEKQPAGQEALHCIQFTSSALRNTPRNWRVVKIFLANWAVKTRSGVCNPETLPWWERVFFWRIFMRKIWKLRVNGISGQEEHQPDDTKRSWKHLLVWRRFRIRAGRLDIRPNPHWITSRPNIALVYLQKGEAYKQRLLSGDNREHNLIYQITPETTAS